MRRIFSWLAAAALALGATLALPARAEQSVQTTASVYPWWVRENPVGVATLIRDSSGLTAIVHTSGLPPGQAVTLWFIVINKPENCSTSPCALPADVFAATTEGDFHLGNGHVIGNNGTATFAGRLNVGETAGSGRIEIGMGPANPLTNPFGAEVVLALHVHGPAQQGAALHSQISTYLGGCETFLGPNGFASGPEDVPTAQGECSTTQLSLHRGGYTGVCEGCPEDGLPAPPFDTTGVRLKEIEGNLGEVKTTITNLEALQKRIARALSINP